MLQPQPPRRVEFREGEALRRLNFGLDDPAGKLAFIECVRDHPVETIHTLEPSLEDVFISLTGRELDA